MDSRFSNETTNIAAVDVALEAAILSHDRDLETMLVLDANKTLASQDTGNLFWRFLNSQEGIPGDPLKPLFKLQGYSYDTFRQVALLDEKFADNYNYLCRLVASEVCLYPEVAALLARVASEPSAGAVIVTCGLR